MEKILILYVQSLKEKLFIAYMMFVLDALDKFPAMGENFTKFTNNFKAAYNHLNQVYLKYDHKLYAERINQANSKRSKAFSRFNNYVRSFTLNVLDEEKTAAAERILAIIKMYGASEIFNLGLRETSTQIVNLIEDLDERLESEIQTLQAGTLLNELRVAQQEFSEIYMERAEYDSEIGRQAMAEARKRMTEAYRSLVTIVNENVPFDTDGTYQPFIRLLNVEIRTLFSHTGQSATTTSTPAAPDDSVGGTPVYKTATFKFADGRIEGFPVEVGTVLIAPSNTEGYRWKPEVPEFMPATNKTFREVPINAEEATATFHFFDHREEEIKQVVGSALTAPANTPGYYWDPEVPSVMPAEDTSYYEMPEEQQEEEEDNRQEYQITYMDANNEDEFDIQMVKEGDPIVPPTPPTGYHWVDVPEVMPARNIYIRCAANA